MKRAKNAVLAGTALFLISIATMTGATAETGDGETAAIKTGAENITLDAGKKAAVPFPHKRHQAIDSITCNACHDLFPKALGSIADLKADGVLGRKQVMKALCISCHKETAGAGKTSGPTSCRACHSG